MATAPANDAVVPEAEQLLPGDYITLDPNEIDIDAGGRIRTIDTVWAEAIGRSMVRDGQLHPIHVCRTAEGWSLAGPGAHRITGARMFGLAIDAKIVTPDQLKQRRREAVENVFRRDNDPLERAASIAELVRLHKLERGIDPTKDGRSASAQARWQKALKSEAADTNVTMTVVYGWTDEVAQQIGVSKSTIERDLLLYRRLAPSLVDRLRAVRHPILGNAGQLRALAKLDEAEQAHATAWLIGDGDHEPVKSVGDALARMRGANRAPSDPEAKRLSAFLGAFQRMGLAEKKGALAELASQLPAGFKIVQVEAEPKVQAPTPAVAIRASVKPDYIACLECGERLEQLGNHLRLAHETKPHFYRDRWKLPPAYPMYAPNFSVGHRELVDLSETIDLIDCKLDEGESEKSLLAFLTEDEFGPGGTTRFANGTYELKISKVKATCTAGGMGLVKAWIAAARRRAEALA